MQEKQCPRCGAAFICNHDNIARCQCSTVKLTPQASVYIKEHYRSCLCAKCLREINQQVKNQ